MKISLITVTYNAEEFLEACIVSVISQTYRDVEYIIVDGGSNDGTADIIKKYSQFISKVISGPDKGIYDAMNKGIAAASGDIIGTLNSDDFFPDDDVLGKIAGAFGEKNTQIVYGNLWYVNPKFPSQKIRRWISQPFKKNLLQWGWMPPHPTFYVRREMFKTYGNYNLSFKTAADYELMLRFMLKRGNESQYLNKVLVMMRAGGISNRTVLNRLSANWNDFRAMRHNGLNWPLLAILLKPVRKITQYF